MRSGAWLTISEISHKTNLGPSQVIGVIRGAPGQYEKQYSLLQLGLLSEALSKTSGRQQKTYKFNFKNPVLLRYVEETLERYRKAGEI